MATFYNYYYVQYRFCFRNHAQQLLIYWTSWSNSNHNKRLQGSHLHNFWISFLGHKSGLINRIWSIFLHILALRVMKTHHRMLLKLLLAGLA